MRHATIRDVAREAAVSVASVSRALNGHENVHPDTRERVLAAAGRLGYVPHAGARSLSMARAHAIGVVLPDLHGEFFSEIVRGMDREASGRGLQLLMSNIHDDAGRAGEALKAMRGRVDGMILMAPHLDMAPLLASLPPLLPTVLINCRGETGGHPTFRVDNPAGVDAMVRHLLATGRRTIAHVRGPLSNLDAEERADAFSRAMRRHAGISDPIVLHGDFSEEAGLAAGEAIAADRRGIDAVFAANDMMAIGCLLALREAGIVVPSDIAVAGFDGIPVSRYLDLTTMRVRIAEIGAAALASLADMVGGTRPVATTVLHAPDLLVRATTAR